MTRLLPIIALVLVAVAVAVYFAPSQAPETDHFKHVVSEGGNHG